MGDLFGDWEWRSWFKQPCDLMDSDFVVRTVLDGCDDAPWHTYQFLTQRPDRMAQYDLSRHWAGVTITSSDHAEERLEALARVKAAVRFVSLEPLVGSVPFALRHDLARAGEAGKVDWVTIGARTGPKPAGPNRDDLSLLVPWLAKYRVPVFMKSNLKPYWHGELRQEFPKEASDDEQAGGMGAT